MIKNDHSKLDEAILHKLREPTSFMGLDAAVRKIAEAADGIDPWRLVDRRVQALRKAGKIVTEKGKWRLV